MLSSVEVQRYVGIMLTYKVYITAKYPNPIETCNRNKHIYSVIVVLQGLPVRNCSNCIHPIPIYSHPI